MTREAADGVCEAWSSPGLCLWDSHGPGPGGLECPLPAAWAHWELSCPALSQPDLCFGAGLSGEKTLLPSLWCSAPWRVEGEASPFSPGSQEELKQGGSSSLLVGLSGPGVQIFQELTCAKECLWPAGAVVHCCSLLGWMCCTTFQGLLGRKLCKAHPPGQ